MRVLLLSELAPRASDPDRTMGALRASLLAAGHEVRALVVDEAPAAEPWIDCLVCHPAERAAELDFPPPRFGSDAAQSFAALSEAQLERYRERLRQKLDQQVDRFDPRMIHCRHLWLFAHLALESGVPYVAQCGALELAEAARDGRYRRFVQEAAENAGAILIDRGAAAAALAADLGIAAEQMQPMPGPESLTAIYDAVLRQRFGEPR